MNTTDKEIKLRLNHFTLDGIIEDRITDVVTNGKKTNRFFRTRISRIDYYLNSNSTHIAKMMTTFEEMYDLDNGYNYKFVFMASVFQYFSMEESFLQDISTLNLYNHTYSKDFFKLYSRTTLADCLNHYADTLIKTFKL